MERPSPILPLLLLLASFTGADLAGSPLSAQETLQPAGGSAERVPAAPPRLPEKPRVLELSLGDAVRIALLENYTVRIAELDEEIRARELVVEKAVFDPFLLLSGSYSKNRRPTVSFLDLGPDVVVPKVQRNPFETTRYLAAVTGRTLIGTGYSFELEESGFDRPLASTIFGLNPQESVAATFRLTQPLLKGAWYPYNSAGIRVAVNNQRMAREDLIAAINDLIFRIEEAYWILVFASQNYQATANALEVAEESLSKARKEEAAGVRPRIYVTTIESQVALRHVELTEAVLLLENARDALLDLLNHGGDSLRDRWEGGEETPPFDDILVRPTTDPEVDEFHPDRDVSLAMAFRNRADYRRFDLALDNQQIAIDVARNELWPRVDLTGSWSQLGLDDSLEGSFSSLGTGEFYSWSVGLEIEIPLFNRGPKNAYQRATHLYRRLHLEKMQVENTIVLQVDQAIRELSSLYRKLQYLDELVRLKRIELDAERKKLEAGTSILFQVHQIENDLIEQQSMALQARADFLTARARYYRATGVILERHQVEVLEGED